MEIQENGVKERLLQAGKKEFLEKGYEKASLRGICERAEVTTGALYFFFRNKEDFFRGIVEETAEHIYSLLRKYGESEKSGTRTSEENDSDLICYLFKKKEEAAILMERAEGSPYENFRQEICKIIEESFLEFFYRFGGRKPEEAVIRIIVKMRLVGYMEVVRNVENMEEAIRYVKLLAAYGDSGFAGMMKQYNKSILCEVKRTDPES